MTLSFIAYPKGSERYQESEKYYREKKIRSPKWNGGLGPEQMDWLRGVLQRAESAKEKVILFSIFLFIRQTRTTFGMPRK